jgi:hypothetical protein
MLHRLDKAMTFRETSDSFGKAVRADLGGRIALRGFTYQHLYALELLKLIREEIYDTFQAERSQDYWVSKIRPDSRALLLVQVKTTAKGCFLGRGAACADVFKNFQRQLEYQHIDNTTAVECRLVVNAHDATCDAVCIPKFQNGALQRLRRYILGKFPRSKPNPVTVQAFLPLRFSSADIASRLGWLLALDPRLGRLLRSDDSTRTWLRVFVGLTQPMFEPWSSSDPTESFGGLKIPTHDTISTGRHLRASLESALQSIVADTAAKRDERSASVKRNAARALRAALSAAPAQIASQLSYAVSESAATDSLRCAAELTQIPSLPSIRELNVSCSGNDQYRFDVRVEGTIPVQKFLRGEGSTHRSRVLLLRSFVHAIRQWVQHGVLYRRSTNDALAWAIRPTAEGAQCVLLDMRTLQWMGENALFASEWADPGPIASTLRYLYYGFSSHDAVIRSGLYRQPWNDNIVEEIARWLESQYLVDLSKFEQDFDDAISDELERWPLAFEGIGDQLFEDLDATLVSSLSEALQKAYPTRVLEDRGPLNNRVVYAFWDDAQLGFTETNIGVLQLDRFVPYYSERWESAVERDRAASDRLSGPRDTPVVVIGLAPEHNLSTVLLQLFGIDIEQYRSWVRSFVKLARDRRTAWKPPALLAADAEELADDRTVLDLLNERRLVFHRAHLSSDSELIIEADSEDLRAWASTLGYDGNRIQALTAYVQDPDQSLFASGPVNEVGKRLVRISLDPDSKPEEIPLRGLIWFRDRGTEAIVRAEEAILRQLRFAQASEIDQSGPCATALLTVEQLAGPELGHNGFPNLWKKGFLNVQFSSSEDRPDRWSETERHSIITGAAGTGKTTVAVKRAQSLLAQHKSRQFPPARVLVLSPSNFGADNFVRTFERLYPGQYNILRFVTLARTEAYEDRLVTDELLSAIRTRYQIVQDSVPMSGDAALSLDDAIAQSLQTLEERFRRCAPDHSRGAPAVFLPSHDRWRRQHLPENVWTHPTEGYYRRASIKHRIDALRAYRPSDLELQTTIARRDLYARVACDLVVTTMDAFDRLNDMHFDCLLVEEASQVRALKLLKAVTKVYRGNGRKQLPAVVLVGDPHQLPPFSRSSPLPAAGRPRTCLAERSFFSAACQRAHPGHAVSALTRQHRMSQNVARVVNSLFYADEKWTYAPSTKLGNGVYWVDTSGSAEEPTQAERSWENMFERGVVIDAVKVLPSRGTTLVIAPYRAQVEKLNNDLGGVVLGPTRNIIVSTIDACQGIEADHVILSMVAIERSFPLMYRRLNVACSRAKDTLIIVGNHEKLRNNPCYNLPACRHIRGLSSLFGPGGKLRENVYNKAGLARLQTVLQ